MTRYRYLDHTADVGIVAWGRDVSEVITAATQGLLDLIAGEAPRAGGEERWIAGTAEDVGGEPCCGRPCDEAVVAYFNELLFVIDVEHWLPGNVAEVRWTEGRVEVRLRGEPFDPERHELNGEVKAATYHQFHLVPAGEKGWELQVIFDVGAVNHDGSGTDSH